VKEWTAEPAVLVHGRIASLPLGYPSSAPQLNGLRLVRREYLYSDRRFTDRPHTARVRARNLEWIENAHRRGVAPNGRDL